MIPGKRSSKELTQPNLEELLRFGRPRAQEGWKPRSVLIAIIAAGPQCVNKWVSQPAFNLLPICQNFMSKEGSVDALIFRV